MTLQDLISQIGDNLIYSFAGTRHELTELMSQKGVSYSHFEIDAGIYVVLPAAIDDAALIPVPKD